MALKSGEFFLVSFTGFEQKTTRLFLKMVIHISCRICFKTPYSSMFPKVQFKLVTKIQIKSQMYARKFKWNVRGGSWLTQLVVTAGTIRYSTERCRKRSHPFF